MLGGMAWSPLPRSEGPRPRPLSDGLDRVLAGLGAPSVDALTTIRDRWAELVGPEAAEALTPVSVEDGRLVAVTASGAWASQAKWLEAGVVARAADLLGPGVITAFSARMRTAR